ncbi:sigma-54 dependent transcriptional regulator [Desulfothermus naphthae]
MKQGILEMDQREFKILVVEDEDIARKNLHRILSKEGYVIESVASGKEAIDLINKKEFDLVVTDLKMEGIDGMEVLKYVKSKAPYTEVIMITGYATVDSAVTAMKEGAFHYIAKPYKLDEVRGIVKQALIKRGLQLENIELRKKLTQKRPSVELIGKSKQFLKVVELAKQVAVTDANVLILGESGTGKELLAKYIHSISRRSNKKFVAFNCGAFTEELIANELFGHEKGAYTGADSTKKGLIEVADGGTLFLDEIGDMPISMQVKLLRAIQEREILRVGGTEPIKVDVRFIAATHRDLQVEVEKGNFRQDLYYRLNVVSLKIPPLAERKEDIPLLANYFLKKKSIEMEKDVKYISQKAMNILLNYSWPGNVRELENVIERAVALANKAEITPDLLPEYLQIYEVHTFRKDSSNMPTLEQIEKDYILWVLEKCGGNRSKAAKILGIDRVSLWRKLKKWI